MRVQKDEMKIREALSAGIFYPEDPAELSNKVNTFLDSVQTTRTDACAILSPHAGFDFAGKLEALAWKAASGRKVDTIVIIAPFHHDESSIIYLPESDYFKTPLGDILIDRTLVEEIESCGTIFKINDIPHFEESSIEVQLPFMKTIFPEANLVPILIGKSGKTVSHTLSRTLDFIFHENRESVLFVGSTNLVQSKDDQKGAGNFDDFLEALSKRESGKVHMFGKSSPCCSTCVATLISMVSLVSTSWVLLDRIDTEKINYSSDEDLVHYAAGAWFPEK